MLFKGALAILLQRLTMLWMQFLFSSNTYLQIKENVRTDSIKHSIINKHSHKTAIHVKITLFTIKMHTLVSFLHTVSTLYMFIRREPINCSSLVLIFLQNFNCLVINKHRGGGIFFFLKSIIFYFVLQMFFCLKRMTYASS